MASTHNYGYFPYFPLPPPYHPPSQSPPKVTPTPPHSPPKVTPSPPSPKVAPPPPKVVPSPPHSPPKAPPPRKSPPPPPPPHNPPSPPKPAPPHYFPPPPPALPPSHSIPPPPPQPGNHSTVIVIVFVSLGGLFFLAFLSVALCCFIKKKKKRTVQETEIISFDDHRKVQEEIVAGPHGEQMTILTIEEDMHIQEKIKKDEKLGHSHIKSALEDHDHHHLQASDLGMGSSSSSGQHKGLTQ